jgi:hypothetical protein
VKKNKKEHGVEDEEKVKAENIFNEINFLNKDKAYKELKELTDFILNRTI